MKRPACYLAAMALHALVLFGVKPSAPKLLPLVAEKKYIEVTLAAPPPPEPVVPPPEVPPVLPPKVEPPPPELPPQSKQEEPLPESKPEPPPAPVAQAEPPAFPTPQPLPPAATDAPTPSPAPAPPPAPGQYLSVTQPSYLSRVEPAYPTQSRRQHEQGTVTLALYINPLGSLDKVEIVTSSGHPLLDEAAVEAMKQSRFKPAYQDNTPLPSRAEVTISFRLQ